MKKVYDFLGVPYRPLAVSEKVHVRNYTKPMPSDLEARLYDFYRPYNKRLERLLGPDWKGAFEKKVIKAVFPRDLLMSFSACSFLGHLVSDNFHLLLEFRCSARRTAKHWFRYNLY